MGYREDIAITYTKDGWDKVVELIGTPDFLTDDQRGAVIDMLNECDQHYVHDNGEVLIVFESVKTSCDDMQVLLSTIHDALPEDEWRSVSCGEDGAEEYGGNYNSSVFGLGVSHSLTFDTSDAEFQSNAGLKNITPVVKAIKLDPNTPPVNDHTCTTCGNAACSSQEKSCWKCGIPI